jgi:hypothetical protein
MDKSSATWILAGYIARWTGFVNIGQHMGTNLPQSLRSREISSCERKSLDSGSLPKACESPLKALNSRAFSDKVFRSLYSRLPTALNIHVRRARLNALNYCRRGGAESNPAPFITTLYCSSLCEDPAMCKRNRPIGHQFLIDVSFPIHPRFSISFRNLFSRPQMPQNQ